MVLTPESFTQQSVTTQRMAPLADELVQQQQGLGFFHRQEPVNNYPHNIQYANNAYNMNRPAGSGVRRFFGNLGGTGNYNMVTGAAAITFLYVAYKNGLKDKKTMCLGTFIAGWLSAAAAYGTPDLFS